MALLLVVVASEPVLVSIQTQTQEDMDSLTAQVDAQAAGSGPARVTLGAIEATMSRVVDVDSPYLVTVPQSVPTLSLLGDISFDPELQLWNMTYETMRTDPSAQINDFKRVLYFTKDNLVQSDTRNPCLTPGTDDAACLHELAASYAVLRDQIPTPDADSLTSDGTMTAGCSDVCQITASLADEPLSAQQTLTVSIPHSVVRNVLATRTVHVSPIYGERTQYSFGVGMLFVSAGNNAVVFDAFDVIENSHDQVAISKLNSYAVAKHVSFWTEVAAKDPLLRIATVEYLLDKGQELLQITAALGGRAINASDCAAMQARIDALSDPTCITQYSLCQPAVYTTGAGATLQTWAAFVLPLPEWHTSSVFKINTLLTTNDTVTNQKILSTLNFETRSPPQPACENAVPVAFDPMQYVVAELFRGHELRVEQITGSFSVQNETAFSMAESLMTVVIRPQNSDTAVEYFEKYPDEHLALDQLYMSHAVHSSVLPGTINNEAVGVENGRSEITLDSALLQTCPPEDLQLYTNPAMECVTTHDWTLQGALARPVSTPTSAACADCHYFVREVGVDIVGDLNWLRTNIFGSSDHGVVEAFYSAVTGLVPSTPRNVRAHAKTYWVWPLYHWPGLSPIGLKDKTIISLSWSIVKSTVPAGGRRLLEAAPQQAPSARTKLHLPHALEHIVLARPQSSTRAELPHRSAPKLDTAIARLVARATPPVAAPADVLVTDSIHKAAVRKTQTRTRLHAQERLYSKPVKLSARDFRRVRKQIPFVTTFAE